MTPYKLLEILSCDHFVILVKVIIYNKKGQEKPAPNMYLRSKSSFPDLVAEVE